jgi:hypothetical protein
MKIKSKLLRLLIVGLVLVVILSCGPDGGDDLPTVTPVPPTKPPAKATSVPVATPAPGETPQPTQPPTDDRQIRQNLLRSTVQIIALVENNGELQPIWSVRHDPFARRSDPHQLSRRRGL